MTYDILETLFTIVLNSNGISAEFRVDRRHLGRVYRVAHGTVQINFFLNDDKSVVLLISDENGHKVWDVTGGPSSESTKRIEELEKENSKLSLTISESYRKIDNQRAEIARLNGATNHAGGTPLTLAKQKIETLTSVIEHEKGLLDYFIRQCQKIGLTTSREQITENYKASRCNTNASNENSAKPNPTVSAPASNADA